MNYNTIIPPFKWFVLENFPYIEDDFDALTNWQLFCKLGKEMNKIIEKCNLTGEQVENLTNAFNSLQNYVNNYFENLDIQEEIDAKLDEMAESGELADIIAQYIQLQGILAYDSVSAMKSAENLVEGSFARTYGYYTYGDKGGTLYKVRQVQNTDVENDEDIIALHDPDLVAEIVVEDSLRPEQIGAKGDGTTDDSTKFSHALVLATNKQVPLQLVGKYKIESPIEYTTGVLVIRGSKAQVPTLIDERTTGGSNLIFGASGYISTNGVANITFENIGFTGVEKGTGKAIVLKSFKNKILNCSFNSFDIAISTEDGTNWTGENQIVNCDFTATNKCIVLNNGSDGDINGCLAPSNCNYFITGGYDSGFKIENNHDYSVYGTELSGYNVNFVGNYVDGWNKLKVSGNSGWNITGNIFIGNIDTSATTQLYAIKFTATTVVSGNISGNILSCNNNNAVYDYLAFIDLTSVSYFANVTISGNNIRIAKKLFVGADMTKTFYTNIEQLTKAHVTINNANATLQTENIQINGNVVMAHTTYNLNSIYNSTIGVLPNICDYWIHCVKMNNGDTYYTFIGDRTIKAQGAYAQATSMDVISIGIRFAGNIPELGF